MILRRPLTVSSISFAGGVAAAGLATVHSCAAYLLLGSAAAAVLLFLCLYTCKYFTEIEFSDIHFGKISAGLRLILIFSLCGIFAGISGIVFASKYGQITIIAGNGYEMSAVAACVLGGISLSGGLGSVLGAAIGGVIMSSISRLLVFLGFSSDYDNTITGIMLIAIVVIDALTQQRSVENARRERLLARASSQTAEKGL